MSPAEELRRKTGQAVFDLLMSKIPEANRAKIISLVEEIKPEAEELVAMSINHPSSVTTKNGYGFWYTHLSAFDAKSREIIGFACIACGANYFGIRDAIKLLSA